MVGQQNESRRRIGPMTVESALWLEHDRWTTKDETANVTAVAAAAHPELEGIRFARYAEKHKIR